MPPISYTLKRNRRSRNIRIWVQANGEVAVHMPLKAPESLAERFVKEKESWIRATQEKLRKRFEGRISLNQTKKDFLEHKEEAREFVTRRIEYFNKIYKFTFKDIRIRNQKSRWGSCSARGNLNFNYGLIKLPQELADYIIVHELCHLREMNHGTHFWELVAIALPNYQELRTRIRKDYIHIS